MTTTTTTTLQVTSLVYLAVRDALKEGSYSKARQHADDLLRPEHREHLRLHFNPLHIPHDVAIHPSLVPLRDRLEAVNTYTSA